MLRKDKSTKLGSDWSEQEDEIGVFRFCRSPRIQFIVFYPDNNMFNLVLYKKRKTKLAWKACGKGRFRSARNILRLTFAQQIISHFD